MTDHRLTDHRSGRGFFEVLPRGTIRTAFIVLAGTIALAVSFSLNG
jgi:hypothetical protein